MRNFHTYAVKCPTMVHKVMTELERATRFVHCSIECHKVENVIYLPSEHQSTKVWL